MSIEEINSDKCSYIYFVDKKELYSVDPYNFIGYYNEVTDLVSYDVKSWKAFQIISGKEIDKLPHHWYVIRNTKQSYKTQFAYLGLKIKNNGL